MTASGMRGIDLFKIAGRSISRWIPSLKTGNPLIIVFTILIVLYFSYVLYFPY